MERTFSWEGGALCMGAAEGSPDGWGDACLPTPRAAQARELKLADVSQALSLTLTLGTRRATPSSTSCAIVINSSSRVSVCFVPRRTRAESACTHGSAIRRSKSCVVLHEMSGV